MKIFLVGLIIGFVIPVVGLYYFGKFDIAGVPIGRTLNDESITLAPAVTPSEVEKKPREVNTPEELVDTEFPSRGYDNSTWLNQAKAMWPANARRKEYGSFGFNWDEHEGIRFAVSTDLHIQPNGLNVHEYWIDHKKVADIEVLLNLIAKCKNDSSTFESILEKADTQFETEAETPISIRTHQGGDFASLFHQSNTISFDLEQLLIFPNPTFSESKNTFNTVPGHPSWAEPLCAVIGHEIAEMISIRSNMLESAVNGEEFDRAKDRWISHHKVANPISDQISGDYFTSDRTRGRDCIKEIDNRKVLLVDMGSGRAIALHYQEEATLFEGIEIQERSAGFTIRGKSKNIRVGGPPEKRLAFISYREGLDFFPPDGCDLVP